MFINIFLLSDEVTVSTLPHPISMFFLGTFAVSIAFMLVEVYRFRKEIEKHKSLREDFSQNFEDFKIQTQNKLMEISKKVDSRVDKALTTLKKLS